MVDGKPFPVAPPWGKVNRVARVGRSRWYPGFGRRPRRHGEIGGESRVGREEDDPDRRDPLSVSPRFPPFLLFKSRFLAFLQKSYLLFLRSKNCETNFVRFLEMAIVLKNIKLTMFSGKNNYWDLILLFLNKFISFVILLLLL